MPAGQPAYVPLANITLSSNASTVTFSNISQLYRDLVLVSVNDIVTTNSQPGVRFNGDTANNYTNLLARGDGSAKYSAAFGSSYVYLSDYSFNTAYSVMHIFDYSATDKHKTSLVRSMQNGSFVMMISSRWANTAAITSLTLMRTSSDQFAANSTFALYGVSA
jgi:hypothetical protein